MFIIYYHYVIIHVNDSNNLTLLCRYNNLLPFQSAREHDCLFEEFTEFQLLNDDTIPKDIWDKATVTDGENEEHRYFRMDILWNYMSTLRTPDHSLRFKRLCKIAKLVLLIPQSNAEEERVFSMVRKNKISFRPSLDPEGTLSSILTVKLANPEPAHKFQPTKELLKTAKSATWEYNKAHVKMTSHLLRNKN